MIKCEICGREFNNLKSVISHSAKHHKVTSKEYYDRYLKKEDEGKCKICGKPTKFIGAREGYSKYCSVACNNRDPEFINKIVASRKNRSDEEKAETEKKRKQTCLDRYGDEHFHNSQKAVESMKNRTPEEKALTQEKRKNTNLNRYGDEQYNNREKFKETWNNKSDDDKKEISDRVRKTFLENNSQDKKLDNFRKTCLEKYGVDHPFKKKEVVDRCLETKKENTASFEKENDVTSIQSLLEEYGYGWFESNIITDYVFYGRKKFVKNSDIPKIVKYATEYNFKGGISHSEKDIVDFIRSIYSGEIVENSRSIIPPLELDIYIPEKKLAIEFNGTYWHSDQCIDKNYHFNKSRQCEEKGIRLIHIYEWEWPSEKIKSLLRISLGVADKIYARDCTVRIISNAEAKPFNEQNHLQGHRNAKVTYGLFYHDNLVQLMSFSQTHYNRNLKDDEWEIIRGCPGSNNVVTGGVGRLFKHFIDDYNPSRVFSYCDFNKFDGTSYEAVGMKFIGYTGPDKTWIINGTPVKRNPVKYQTLKKLSDAIVWGSGSKKYEWRLPNEEKTT